MATFRLVHGDNKIEFGDKASVDIQVKEYPNVSQVEEPLLSFDNVVEKPAELPVEVPAEKVEEPKKEEQPEEQKVSDKEIAMMRS